MPPGGPMSPCGPCYGGPCPQMGGGCWEPVPGNRWPVPYPGPEGVQAARPMAPPAMAAPGPGFSAPDKFVDVVLSRPSIPANPSGQGALPSGTARTRDDSPTMIQVGMRKPQLAQQQDTQIQQAQLQQQPQPLQQQTQVQTQHPHLQQQPQLPPQQQSQMQPQYPQMPQQPQPHQQPQPTQQQQTQMQTHQPHLQQQFLHQQTQMQPPQPQYQTQMQPQQLQPATETAATATAATAATLAWQAQPQSQMQHIPVEVEAPMPLLAAPVQPVAVPLDAAFPSVEVPSLIAPPTGAHAPVAVATVPFDSQQPPGVEAPEATSPAKSGRTGKSWPLASLAAPALSPVPASRIPEAPASALDTPGGTTEDIVTRLGNLQRQVLPSYKETEIVEGFQPGCWLHDQEKDSEVDAAAATTALGPEWTSDAAGEECRESSAMYGVEVGPTESPIPLAKPFGGLFDRRSSTSAVSTDSMADTVFVESLPSGRETQQSQANRGASTGAIDQTIHVAADVRAAVAAARAAVEELQRTAGRQGVRSTPIVAMPILPPRASPFSQEAVGLNILLSEDGFMATRNCGCRESVAIGSAPLSRQPSGLYFEVEVCQTVEGWLGGLGIGVTHTAPSQQRDHRLPDKAWRLPGTFILGYSGVRYLDGSEAPIDWQPDTLRVGQRVGLLVTGDGRTDMVAFVDGKEVARVPGKDLRPAGLRDEPLYAIVDVYNAVLAVKLLPDAVAPERINS
eukprot:TRINITY_DN17339_c0_g1_i1.p1 TRINITY_DN17339_c0_g1~~TRINITY_DN17339_c0_g1_i1.p1  ORF type:complete len:757 (+),score=136.40 TRINITY_DN17339_c0_g1_i1:76-2271(+)